MSVQKSVRKANLLSLLILAPVLLLAACGTTTTTTGSGPAAPSSIHLTVGGKLDTEAQLITKMYVLLLKKAGYQVTEKAALGANNVVFSAINSGQIDLYPEFTATGLAKLGLTSANDADKDYNAVKQGYEKQYHITWLDKSPLNDTYGVCAPKGSSKLKGATSISQLAPVASQLSVASPPDGIKFGTDVLKSTYNLNFKGITTYNEEGLTFPAVTTGQQDLNICYTTAALIAKDNFFVLKDDKNVFPAYNPAPIVRDDTLQKAPGIKDALNKLAPYLTTEVSQELQKQVSADGKSVTDVATTFLKSKGLL